MWKKSLVAAVAALVLSDATARAVILIGGDGRNESAPTGPLGGSGWDLQGNYGDFLGTPIAPNWFLTASHFGEVDNKLTLADGAHHVAQRIRIGGSDLVLNRVIEPFTTYASIFNASTDGGPISGSETLVVFGRGWDRGSEVTGKGWHWGTNDKVLSWGTNTADAIVALTASDVAGTDIAVGTRFLQADFDQTGGATESTLTYGDSSGGLFVQRKGVWKLVGINYGGDVFREAPSSSVTPVAAYDSRGLYNLTNFFFDQYAYINPANYPDVRPQTWDASYVPDYLTAINAITIPEPATVAGLGVSTMLLLRRRRSNA